MIGDFEWTADAITRLRTLWAEGLSTAAIGRAMGVSKNAVVGKAGRLGLPCRPSPIRPPSERPARPERAGRITLPALKLPAARALAIHPATKGDHRKLADRPPAIVATPPEPPPRRLSFRPCCWPLWGERERPTHQYCEAPQGEGWLPYCPAHQARATARTRSEGEIAADALRGPKRPGFVQNGWGR